MPGEMIAYCGLDCAQCPSYTATQTNDMDVLAALAEKWNKEFGGSLTAEACICDGCKANGRKIAYCGQCAVRACASGRGVENCAHCEDYNCEKLTDFLAHADEARVNLERIRLSL